MIKNIALPCLIASALSLACMNNALAMTPESNSFSMASINNAALLDTIDANASADAILRAQILLDRAHFSPGEIDARFGANMRKAISAYQSSKNIAATGSIDSATWALLNSDTLPASSNYTITAADSDGPFVAMPVSMLAKSKLSALAYSSSLEALSEKFHINPSLLQRLNSDKNLKQSGTVIVVPNVLSPEPLPAANSVLVDRSDASVSVLDANGKILARYPASTGSSHDPLPVGAWKIQGVARNPTFNYNPKLFWDAKAGSAKAKIAAGPNNPVGIVWIDLSKPHYGIHGTPEPAKIGKTESHGCIRLSNWNADSLAAAVSPGMPALLQE